MAWPIVLAFTVLGIIVLGFACKLLGISAWLFVLAKLRAKLGYTWHFLEI